MDAAKAKKDIAKLTEQLETVHRRLKDYPLKFEAAILDKLTEIELKEAVSDLATLSEVIIENN
jgi:hypothetical protein